MFDKLTGVLFPPVLPLYFPQPFRSPSRGSFHAFPGLKFYFLSGFLKFFIFFQITCCNFQDFCYNSFCSGVWRSLVARSAGGREVAGSNPVTPIFCFKKDFWKLIPEILQTVDKVGAGIIPSTTFLHIAILLSKILKNSRFPMF